MDIDYKACPSAINGVCEITRGYCNGNYYTCCLNNNRIKIESIKLERKNK